jgi:hypothetical protein
VASLNLTRWLILSIVTSILIVDIGLAAFGGMQMTISYEMTRLGFEYPATAFAMGFLMGHWYGQLKKGDTGPTVRFGKIDDTK